MPRKAASSPPAPALVREPQQDRSRASFEKVVAAARALLQEREYDSFTLIDVVRLSGVSLGSIYARVKSKDDLLRVVQERVLEDLAAREQALFDHARWRDIPLARMLPLLLEEVAEELRENASLLRAFMHRAATDARIGQVGRAAGLRAGRMFQEVLLLRRHEFRHPDPERAALACFNTAYAVYGRHLGFGVTDTANDVRAWHVVKEDVALTCASFLQYACDVRLEPVAPATPARKRPAQKRSAAARKGS